MSNILGHNPPPGPEDSTWSSYAGPATSPKKASRTGPILLAGLIGLLIGVGGTLGALALTTSFGDRATSAGPPAMEEEPHLGAETPGPSVEESEEPTEERPTPSPTAAKLRLMTSTSRLP